MQSATLPQPSSEALTSSLSLQKIIQQTIIQSNGWIPFSQFMELALYAPQYGYYTGGAHKIGTSGDFITAPSLHPIFGQTIAQQINSLLPQTAGNLYEFGAGTGALASSLLNHTDGIQHYYIIELSNELAERQLQYIQQHAPKFANKVIHLNKLPKQFDGIIIGNEVLDAMPIEIITHRSDGMQQVGVSWVDGQFKLIERALESSIFFQTASNYFPDIIPYTSEIHPTQYAFVRTLAEKLVRGGMIWIDYGFDASQYYHPQRQQGTLIGHYRHHVIHDPFFHIGLTDLTAHVNFTDIAQAGIDGGLDLIGYLPQSHFLLNLGILDLLANSAEPTSPHYLQAASAVHQMINQHEMGELFKVMALGKHIDVDWQGFQYGDICHKL